MWILNDNCSYVYLCVFPIAIWSPVQMPTFLPSLFCVQNRKMVKIDVTFTCSDAEVIKIMLNLAEHIFPVHKC